MQSVDTLNSDFGTGKTIRFTEGLGGFPVAEIRNDAAVASVCVYGAHVMHYQPEGDRPVLWMSPNAVFTPGKAIRGGIPVCWPWFGAATHDASLPMHGLVRTRLWSVVETAAEAPDRTILRLAMEDDPDTRAVFPHSFRVTLTVSVGPTLTLTLEALNTGTEPFSITAALHNYFAISDVRNVSVTGLEGCRYLDTVGGANRPCVQQGPITFTQETDRDYLNTEAECIIHDPGWNRRIHVRKRGSRSTVVWNPWTDKAARLSDLGEENFPRFVCVETANCSDDAVRVPPGETGLLETEITAEA